MESYGQLAFNLDFYTEVQDLDRLVDAMGADRFSKRFRKLSSGLCEVRLPTYSVVLSQVAQCAPVQRSVTSGWGGLPGCRHRGSW